MEKGEKSSPSPSRGINYFDTANLLGPSPFSSAPATIAPSFAHLAHMPSAFSMLGRLPPFAAPPPFGGLGGLSDPLRTSAALAHSSFLHSAFASTSPLSLVSPLKLATSLSSPSSSSTSSKVTSSKTSSFSSSDLMNTTNSTTTRNSTHIQSQRRSPGKDTAGRKSRGRGRSSRSYGGIPTSVISSAQHKSDTALLEMGGKKGEFSSRSSSAFLSSPSLSMLPKAERTSKSGQNSSNESDSQSDVSSVSSVSSDDSSGSSDEGGDEKEKNTSRKKSRKTSPGGPVIQIDGAKKQLMADQIRQKMQNKAAMPPPSSPGKSEGHRARGRGRPPKNPQPSLTEKEQVEQKRRQEELKQQLEAELKQQQLQLKLIKRAQAQKEKEANLKAQKPNQPEEALNLHKGSSPSRKAKPHPSKSVEELDKGRQSDHLVAKFKTLSEGGTDSNHSDLSSDSESEVENEETGSGLGSSPDGDDSDQDKSVNSEGSASPTKGDKRTADESSDGSTPHKRRRVVDETELRIPLEHGWRRETRIRTVGLRGIGGEVLYYAPCGKKLKTYPDVTRYLNRNGITDLTRENFTFSTKYNIGDFMEARHGENGFTVLSEEAVVALLSWAQKKTGRPNKNLLKQEMKRRQAQDLARQAMEGKLKRKLEQQGTDCTMSRRTAEMKLLRKLEKQRQKEQEKRAKEMKVVERRKQKDRLKMMKQHEKIQRQEQMRIEREMRAQQIIESNLMWYQLEREREMKRQQAVLLKEQEREWQKQMMIIANMERERRRQHMLLVKALEARKKQEEKEKLKEEKKAEKMMVKEKKFEQRRLELQLAQELRQPREDMELRDFRPMPELNRLAGIKLPGAALADCLMVLEFLNNFGEALGVDADAMPNLDQLQKGLMNENEDAVEELMSLVTHLVQFAVDDPGVPNPKEAVTKMGVKITDVDVNDAVVSEVLRLFIQARAGKQQELCGLLVDKPLEALNTTQKAAILAFLCNELLCSRVITSEIDNNIETMSGLRRDKWIVEGKLRKLRTVVAKKFNRPEINKGSVSQLDNLSTMSNSMGGETDADVSLSQNMSETANSKHGSDDEDEESGNESDATNATGNNSAEEDDPGTIEECEKKIEKLAKQHGQYRNKVFNASHKLRGICFGQDRYKRLYWAIPYLGGIFVEGLESGEVGDEDPQIDSRGKSCHPDQMADDVKKRLEECKEEIMKLENGGMLEDSITVKTEPMDTSEQNGVLEGSTICPSDMSEEQDKKDPLIKTEQNGFNHTSLSTSDQDCPDESKTTLCNGDLDMNTSCDEDSKMIPDTGDTDCASNLFLQKSNSTKLSEFINIAKSEASMEGSPMRNHSSSLFTSSPITNGTNCSISNMETNTTESKPSFLSIDSMLKKDDNSGPSLFNNHFLPPGLLPAGPFSAEQMLKNLSDRQNQKPWFSILPRLPCDDLLITRDQGNCAVPPRAHLNNSSMPFLSPVPFRALQMQSPTFASFQMGQIGVSPSDYNLLPFTPKNSSSVTEDSFKVPNTPGDCPTTSNSPAPSDLLKYEPAEPMPIPQDAQRGWWRISEAEQLKAVVRCLHPRGIRERNLQKTFQKLFDFACQSCSKGDRDAIAIEESEKSDDEAEDEPGEESTEKDGPAGDGPAEDDITDIPAKEDKEDQEEIMEKSKESSNPGSCFAPVPDDPNVWDAKVAFDIETSILEEVESMEDRIFTASLQVKGWKLPQKVAELEDKEPVARAITVLKRNQIYPLDVAKDKLLHLEKNIERRYLRPPFCKSIQLKLENITAKLGELANSSSERRRMDDEKKEDKREEDEKGREDPVEEEEEEEEKDQKDTKEEKLPAGLVAWRTAVAKATSPAQLALCLYQLNRSIAWEKSIMKVLCQICRKDDNEAELLLCDSCDKGYHTYCFKPKLVTIPDGDWYCFECISKATGQPHCAVCGKKTGKLLECSTCPRAVHMDCMETPPAKVPKKWFCASCMAEKAKNKRDRKRVRREEKKEAKKERKDSESAMDTSTSETKSKKVKCVTAPTVVDVTPDSEDLEPCRVLMPELEKHDESWPFLQPVNTKQFPQYKKFIKQPMDFSTMRIKLRDNVYKSRGEFAADARLVFNNCETFNEDDSEVGKAGHTMRKVFEQSWKELCSGSEQS